ncbi:hypothetical protein Tco_0546555 [Tanacetum coccineum]
MVSNRDIYTAGHSLNAKVSDIIIDNSWRWPNDWSSKFPLLNNLVVPQLSDSMDRFIWRDLANMDTEFSVKAVWENIRPRGNMVDWFHVVWYSMQIWDCVKCLTGIPNIPSRPSDIVDYLIPMAKMKSARCVMLLYMARTQEIPTAFGGGPGGKVDPVSMWFDRWCAASPLYSIISSRDIFRAGWNLSSKVRDLIHDGVWKWPVEWLNKHPLLGTIPVPTIQMDKKDYLEWRDSDGIGKPFLVSHVWHSIRPRADVVPWFNFDVAAGLAMIWTHLKSFVGLSRADSSLDSIISLLLPIAKRKYSKSTIGKLVVAAAAYFIWQERNRRLFKNSKRSVKEVIDCAMSSIRMKLMSCHFKKSKDGVMFARLWELPSTCFK